MIRIAWRNIWRNKRRSGITIASVFFAVFFCVITTSINEGVWDKMIDNTLRTQTGHIQIHGKGYWDDKVTDNFMAIDAATITRLEAIEHVTNVSPRVETFAMASLGSVSKGIGVVGISPKREAEKSSLPVRLVRGGYLSEDDEGALIGEGLAKYLGATVGDTLAFIGQGYHGASALGLFPVRGILRLMTPEENEGLAYITLPAAQRFIDMPDGYSGILIALDNNRRMDETLSAVRQVMEMAPVDVLPWTFTMERLLQSAESDKAFNKVMLFILYLIVGFGILGTVIMLSNERKEEFRVMVSLGMQRQRLAATVGLELLIMSMIGVVAALAVTVPLTYVFAAHPIEMSGEVADMYYNYGMEPVIPTSTATWIFVQQILVVLLITLIASAWPVRKIRKMRLINGE
jgi:ABC-type lipoprotein release transport system permease subunit